MAGKYFTISYDDGLEQDRAIIRLMEQYGIRGTFNISSDLFGKKSYIRRFGDLGLDAKPGARSKRPGVVVPHFILERKEALALYGRDCVEVAGHGAHHRNQRKFTPEEAQAEVVEDLRALSELFGYRVVGHAFPYGSYNQHVLTALKDAGVKYARTATMGKRPKNFDFDRNQLLLQATCWHLDAFAESLLDQFISAPITDTPQVFYMWGHGYELDYGTARGNYAHLERLFQKVSRAKDIQCVTNRELYGGAL